MRRDGMAVDEQAHLQRIRYHWDDARIVLIDDAPAGLLKVHHDEQGWYVIQIQVVPSRQGQGLGSRLLGSVLQRADDGGQQVRLYVIRSNPARRLYERLGFRICERGEHVFLMCRPPGTGPVIAG